MLPNQRGTEGRNQEDRKWSRRSVLLSFVLILLFDIIVLVFLFVVFVKQQGSIEQSSLLVTRDSLSDDEYQNITIFDLDIKRGMFDIVVLSLARCMTGLTCYGVLRWIIRTPIVLTTVVSTLYILVKAAVYNYTELPPAATQPLYLMIFFFMLLSTVLIAWLAAFFFEFKYLSGELSYYKVINWRNWKAWLWPRGLRRQAPTLRDTVMPNDRTPLLSNVVAGSESSSIENGGGIGIPAGAYYSHDTPYLTPVGSEKDTSSTETLSLVTEGSSTTPESNNTPLHFSPEELHYKAISDQTLQSLNELLSVSTVWILEKTDPKAQIATYSHTKNKAKILKLETVLPYNIEDIWTILCKEVSMFSQWNPEILENRILYKINEVMDILYTVTAPQAGGMVSSRDFVSLRTLVHSPDMYMSLGTAVDYHGMPPVHGRIRGENIVSAYVIMKETDRSTKLVWCVQTDLKGWLPKYLIDQALTSLLGQTIANLQAHLKQRHGETGGNVPK